MKELKPIKEGKVREIYDNGDSLIMVATDRISCFDVILKNIVTKKGTVEKLVLYIEICSEFPFYDMNHKSDITFWINDKEVTTYTCKGDYGDRRGKQNPDWWLDVNTQYGEMVTLSVDDKGVYINGTLVNDKITIWDLKLEKDNNREEILDIIDFYFDIRDSVME